MPMFRLLHAAIGSDPSVRLVSDGIGTLTLRTQIRFSWSSSVGAPRHHSVSWILIR